MALPQMCHVCTSLMNKVGKFTPKVMDETVRTKKKTKKSNVQILQCLAITLLIICFRDENLKIGWYIKTKQHKRSTEIEFVVILFKTKVNYNFTILLKRWVGRARETTWHGLHKYILEGKTILQVSILAGTEHFCLRFLEEQCKDLARQILQDIFLGVKLSL